MWGISQHSYCLLRLCSKFAKESNKSHSLRLISKFNANAVLKTNSTYTFSTSATTNNSSTTLEIADQQVELNVADITEGNPELENKLKILLLETDVMRQEGKNVPDIIKEHHWKELLKLPTTSSRRKYLVYLFKTEKSKENDKLKKEEKRLAREESLANRKDVEEDDDGQIKYGLQYNNIFLRFYDTTINNFYNNRLINAIQFGQKLVVDCSYDEHMTTRESLNCAKQLMLLFADNRVHDDPFDLHFCNILKTGGTMTSLNRYITTMYEPHFPLNLHENSYLEHFPKEKLIYLTPHCREELDEFDHEAVYVIGAMVDKMNSEPLSLAKAKANDMKMAKLPLDRYLQWGSGAGKSLTLNQMVSILLDMKRTGDWTQALKHVPRRKIEHLSSPSIMKTYSPRHQHNNYNESSISRQILNNARPYRDSYGTKNDKTTYKESTKLTYTGDKFSFKNRNAKYNTDDRNKIVNTDFVKNIIKS